MSEPGKSTNIAAKPIGVLEAEVWVTLVDPKQPNSCTTMLVNTGSLA